MSNEHENLFERTSLLEDKQIKRVKAAIVDIKRDVIDVINLSINECRSCEINHIQDEFFDIIVRIDSAFSDIQDAVNILNMNRQRLIMQRDILLKESKEIKDADPNHEADIDLTWTLGKLIDSNCAEGNKEGKE